MKRLLSGKDFWPTRSYRIGPTGAAHFSTFNYRRGIFLERDDPRYFSKPEGFPQADFFPAVSYVQYSKSRKGRAYIRRVQRNIELEDSEELDNAIASGPCRVTLNIDGVSERRSQSIKGSVSMEKLANW